MKRGFTLVELLVVASLMGLLSMLMLPALKEARESSRKGACASNLRQMYTAYMLYLNDHDGQFFPLRSAGENGGALWYFGLETAGGSGEGTRKLDRSKAVLAPYLGVRTVETCPSFPYGATSTKRKYETASYGYGINVYLLAQQRETRATGITNWLGLARPAQTLVWGDAAQINMFQPPASPKNPMLEEWYYLASRPEEQPAYHFRHGGCVQLVFGDGRVISKPPHLLLPYVDGKVGYLEPSGSSFYLTAAGSP
jgi:prepilin-type N-terminal cleavage/methylation domain-containing protein